MNTYKLSGNDLKILQSIIKNDIEQLANSEAAFFDDLNEQKISLKDYINERISVANTFEIDFWKVVRSHCNHYIAKRLEVLYEGKSLKEFDSNYDVPDYTKEFIKNMLGK